MLGIHGKGNKQRRKEDSLKEERTQEWYFQFPACRKNKENAEQEVVETHGRGAAQFLQHQFLSRDRRARI